MGALNLVAIKAETRNLPRRRLCRSGSRIGCSVRYNVTVASRPPLGGFQKPPALRADSYSSRHPLNS